MHPHTHTSKQSKNQSILYLRKRPNNQDPISLIDSWAKQISLEARQAQRATSLLVLGDNESSIWLNKTTHLRMFDMAARRLLARVLLLSIIGIILASVPPCFVHDMHRFIRIYLMYL